MVVRLRISGWFSSGPDVCLQYPVLRLLALVVLRMALKVDARIALMIGYLLVWKQDLSAPAYRAVLEIAPGY